MARKYPGGTPRKHPHGHKMMKDGKSRVYTKPAEHAETRGTLKGLNQKELDFIKVFAGDPVAAAKEVGYKAPHQAVKRLMIKSEIVAAIRDRENKELFSKVASRVKRQEFWTDVMHNEEANMANRLKASELLGKSEGDFIERHVIEEDTLEARLRRLHQLRLEAPQPEAIEMKPCEGNAVTFEPAEE